MKLHLFVCLALAIGGSTLSWGTDLGPENFKFVDYPGFPEQHSTWGSIGYSEKFDRVVIGVTDHFDTVYIYSYDPVSGVMEKGPEITRDGHLLGPYQWQGKIHSQMIENKKDGWIYFGTDEGLERWVPYGGGYFMKYHPITHELVNLGLGSPGLAIKEFCFDQKRQRMYGIGAPDNYIIIKDLETKETRNLGSINKKYPGRVTFTDDWGNLYLADQMGHLVKYEPATDSIHFSKNPLPVSLSTDGRDTGWRNSFGLKGWARYKDTNNFYVLTYTRHVIHFIPEEFGMGEWRDLGLVYEGDDVPRNTVIDHAYTPNFVCGNNHKLYYWAGGHGHHFFPDVSVLIEMDPATGETSIVYKAPTTEVLECTGSDVKDKYGNLYFAGTRHVEGREAGESGSSVPHLVIFNPETPLK